jgi:hypothetical protein
VAQKGLGSGVHILAIENAVRKSCEGKFRRCNRLIQCLEVKFLILPAVSFLKENNKDGFPDSLNNCKSIMKSSLLRKIDEPEPVSKAGHVTGDLYFNFCLLYAMIPSQKDVGLGSLPGIIVIKHRDPSERL